MGKEKKEIGKLLELLNEYAKVLGIGDYVGWHNKKTVENSDYIFTKKFGFIKWLVENDKINLVKVYENLTNYEIEIRIRAVKELLENNEEDTIAYLKLLMILAIQDEPIRFLCEIIK